MGKEYVPSGIPFLRAENLQGDAVILDKNTLFIDNETDKTLARSRIFSGDVLISIAGTIGRAAIVPANLPQMNCNQAVAIVRIDDYLEPKFFLHWLKTPDSQAQMAGARVTQTISNLSLGQIKKLRIPLPPIAEQRRIVEILDQADSLRKKRAEANAKAERILPALFIKMFGDPATNPRGWDIVPLAEIAKGNIRNGLSPSYKGIFDGEVLTLSAITQGKFDTSAKKLAKFGIEPPRDKMVRSSDFLVCRGNGNLNLVGRGKFPDQDLENVLFPDTMIGVPVDLSIIQKDYLEIIWESESARTHIEQRARTTNGTHKINQKSLGDIPIMLPDITLQKEFSQAAAEVKNTLHNGSKNLTKLKTLFQNLLHRAFSGDLTAEWRKAHMAELLQEMEHQTKVLGLERAVEYEQLGILEK